MNGFVTESMRRIVTAHGIINTVMKERVQRIPDNILGYLLYLSEVKDPEGELRKEDLELYRFMEKYAYGKR